MTGKNWRRFLVGKLFELWKHDQLQGTQIFVDNCQEGLCHGRCGYSLVRQVEKTWFVICHIMLLSIYLKLSGKKLLHFYRIPVKKEQYGSCHLNGGSPRAGLVYFMDNPSKNGQLGLPPCGRRELWRRPCSNVWATARQKWRSPGDFQRRDRNKAAKWGELHPQLTG